MSDRWLRTFSLVSDLFNDRGIEYVFPKLLIPPPRTDVDVMITDPLEEAKALELLKREGFSSSKGELFKTPKILTHPRRRICRRDKWTEIDLYPDANWDGWKVANGKEIMSRRVRSEVEGKEVWLPSPSDLFYLIVTHAFSHLRIKFEEVQNCAHLVSECGFSWDHVYGLSSEYGTRDSIYLFLRTLAIESDVPKSVLAKFSQCGMGRWINAWLERKESITFPLEVSGWFNFLSSFPHTSRLRGKASGREIASNFLWHYVRVAMKAVRGR